MKYTITESTLRKMIREAINEATGEGGQQSDIEALASLKKQLEQNSNERVFQIFPDLSNEEVKGLFRPEWCYADGELERDLGRDGGSTPDYFYLSPAAARFADGNRGLKPGKYRCEYKGKPCTLYVSPYRDVSNLCFYDSDSGAIFNQIRDIGETVWNRTRYNN